MTSLSIPLLRRVLAVLPPLPVPDHPDGLALPPLVPRIASGLVVEWCLAVLGDGPVAPVQLLIAALLRRPLVAAQVSASTPGVGEHVSAVLVIFVTAGQHDAGSSVPDVAKQLFRLHLFTASEDVIMRCDETSF